MNRESCPNITLNSEQCPCTNKECSRFGLCCECVRNHRKNGSPVFCMRAESLEQSKVPREEN